MNRLARLIPLLLLASVFLGWKSYRAWTDPEPADREFRAVGAELPAGDNVSVRLPEAELAAAVARITAHPLFRPDRQPYKEVPFQTAAPQRNHEAEIARFTVIGILPIDGVERAIVTRKGTGSSTERWELAPGDALPGFTAKAIRPEGVTLEADGREFLLPLYAGAPKSTGPGPLRTEGTTAPQAVPPPAAAGGHPAVPPSAPSRSPVAPTPPSGSTALPVVAEDPAGAARPPGQVRPWLRNRLNSQRVLPPRPVPQTTP